MAQAPYSIGRNCRVTFLWAGSRIDLRDVTGFMARQMTQTLRAAPLNKLPVQLRIPDGWEGRFQIARANANLDELVAQIESGFWSAGIVNQGTIYQYIDEPDGSTTTWEYSQVAFGLNTDEWRQENLISQTAEFYASQRTQIS